MKTLEDLVRKYYEEDRYNCGETLIHAGNEYWNLGLHEGDMRMLAGFGSGMYSGSTCGTLIGSAAVISKLVVETKAHDHLDQLRPVISACYRNFKEVFGSVDCAHIRPLYHTRETRCLNTCLLAAAVLKQTLEEHHIGTEGH